MNAGKRNRPGNCIGSSRESNLDIVRSRGRVYHLPDLGSGITATAFRSHQRKTLAIPGYIADRSCRVEEIPTSSSRFAPETSWEKVIMLPKLV